MHQHRPKTMTVQSRELYIGLMSGTSIDGIDAALVDFSEKQPKLINTYQHSYSEELRERIAKLCLPGNHEIDTLGQLDIELGKLFAGTVNALIANTKDIQATDILAIGSHGQTIRHRPEFEYPFTLQITDPNTIAELTGITTIADFRRKDMAAGGQGAPLAPAFHHDQFTSDEVDRCVINIGGIANITWLPKVSAPCGFDTGPGNTLMDAWIQEIKQIPYDHQGEWARSGEINDALLSKLKQHKYFNQTPPKSTGREVFSKHWLFEELNTLAKKPSNEAIQASLCELTATSIAEEVIKLSQQTACEVYICGGGAHNTYLMERLKKHLPICHIDTTHALGVAPDWVEAMAFAWLAKMTRNHKPGNLPEMTGASRATILGGIYYP